VTIYKLRCRHVCNSETIPWNLGEERVNGGDEGEGIRLMGFIYIDDIEQRNLLQLLEVGWGMRHKGWRWCGNLTNVRCKSASRRKDLVCIGVSEASAHGQLDPLFLDCDETAHPGAEDIVKVCRAKLLIC
jgi:hypothetical protein